MRVDGMKHRVDEPPVVQCPGCQQPMEPKERSSITDRLVDIRYVCPACGTETKRSVKDESPVVQCPGCQQPMEPKERTSVTDCLVDSRYVCPACGTETKRTVKEEA